MWGGVWETKGNIPPETDRYMSTENLQKKDLRGRNISFLKV